jgi:hypothetical protein
MNIAKRLRVSPRFIERWQADEFASWEDHKRPTAGAHPYVILSKAASVIIIETEAERDSLLKSADHWLDYYSYEINLPAVARAFRRVIAWLKESECKA